MLLFFKKAGEKMFPRLQSLILERRWKLFKIRGGLYLFVLLTTFLLPPFLYKSVGLTQLTHHDVVRKAPYLLLGSLCNGGHQLPWTRG